MEQDHLAVKVCTKCGIEKPMKAFHVQRSQASGRTPRCKTCTLEAADAYRNTHKATINSKLELAKQTDPDRFQDYYLRNTYKITLKRYRDQLTAQGNRCACCGADSPGWKLRWCVDHDHACCPSSKCCGTCFRGLLCSSCNLVLGHVKDDTDRLRKIIAYLEQQKQR